MTVTDLLFGLETEYAIAGLGASGPVDRGMLLRWVMELARRELVNLPDLHSPGGLFLGNGSRFYADCGSHPEISTPECTNPWDVVAYTTAGHKILSRLVASVGSNKIPEAELMCFRSNVDYSGTHSTWGCHESYLHRSFPKKLQAQLIPHLVSRLVYTGAGGFNPFSRGLEFTLSPRVAHLQQVVSENSTGERGIWHTKSESLCRGYNRLHILCGDGNCSETSAFLKAGATALVVAMADAGITPGDAVQLAAPLPAMRGVSADVTCGAPLLMADGSRRTALAIQRHYLEWGKLTWAPSSCRRGRRRFAVFGAKYSINWKARRDPSPKPWIGGLSTRSMHIMPVAQAFTGMRCLSSMR